MAVDDEEAEGKGREGGREQLISPVEREGGMDKGWVVAKGEELERGADK